LHDKYPIITFVSKLTKWLNNLVELFSYFMKTENLKAEEKILKAAEDIFLRDGYSGSRMQDIADSAGINKAMLHYYFRSKDKLFEHIFDKKVSIMFPQMEELFETKDNFIDIISTFVEKYLELLIENPFLPLFVVSTINKADNEEFIEKLPTRFIAKLIEKYYEDLHLKKVRELNPFQFVMSVFSMCAFPFMAKPMILKATNANNEVFAALMQSRASEIQLYVRLILNP
jgi:TetR/AcrR family transcriptional regulator